MAEGGSGVMIDCVIRTRDDLARAIHEAGILPFFANAVKGWSAEEHVAPAKWFTDGDGPWEWKGPLAAEKICVYGKFVRNKAAFVSPEWFPDLCNYRRDGYDWEGFEADGLAPYRERLLMRYLEGHPYVLSKYAKRECGFAKGYDTAVTHLQMQTFVVLADFQYSITRDGAPYGWGNAVLEVADRWLGADALTLPERRAPRESFERMIRHLRSVLPEADEQTLRKELK